MLEVAQWSEQAGFRGILIYSDNTQCDPWAVAQLILENTKTLCPLIAVQPIYMHPYRVAKKVATLDTLYERRIYLNMIAGGFRNDLSAMGDTTEHDRRYERLSEYTQIISALLRDEKPFNFDGEFYQIKNLRLAPGCPEALLLGIFMSGSSESGKAAARACDAEELLVLDSKLAPARRGEVAELYIEGVGLSPGYWNNNDATVAAFIQHPTTGERIYRTGDLARIGKDGQIYFVGRADSQVKSRGFRIELGEIEAALNKISMLRDSAMIAIPGGGFDGAVLCCSYVALDQQNGDVNPIAIRAALSHYLPNYMMPSRWKQHAALPRNGSGKIDRRQLKELWLTPQSPTKRFFGSREAAFESHPAR